MNVKRLLNTFCQLNLSHSNERLKVPVFRVNSANITVIKSPTEFYNTLKELAEQSKKRISISSLYLGTGPLEKDLVHSISEVQSQHKDLDLTFLFDYNRATRESISTENGQQVVSSSKSVLLPLVRNGAKVNFYLTLKLSGWRNWIQRKQKWNELSSLHHMKLYLFDDNLVISGANLSDMYFTNRQDRYLLIRDSPQVCDYFDQLIKTVSKFSMKLQNDGEFKLHSNWKYDPRKYWHQSMFRKSAQKEIVQLNEQFSSAKVDLENADTVIFPLLQMKSIGINDEEQFTSSLIQSCPNESSLHLATGYFNLTKAYQKTLLTRQNQTPTSILMASEEANGFFNGNGILRFIPLVYTHYVKSFLKRSQGHNENDIAIWYYNRPDWSFHAKGIWLFAPKFFMTVVGSTNFGYRSVYRDNEAQIVILSKNKRLECSFYDEHRALIADSRPILDQKEDLPKVPFWVSCFATLFRSYF